MVSILNRLPCWEKIVSISRELLVKVQSIKSVASEYTQPE